MREKPMGQRHTIKLLAQIAISAVPEASIGSHPIILLSVDDLFYSPFTYPRPARHAHRRPRTSRRPRMVRQRQRPPPRRDQPTHRRRAEENFVRDRQGPR